MSPNRLSKTVAFLSLFVLIELSLEWTGLRPKSFTAAVDSISVNTGLRPAWVEDAFVAVAAYLVLRVLAGFCGSFRLLTGERPSELRMTKELAREVDDTE